MEPALSAPAREGIGCSRRIRILFVITTLETGGAQVMLYKLLARMDRWQFDPSVICLGSNGAIGARIEALGIPVRVVGISATLPSLKSLWRLRRWVRDLRPDLIQGWMYHGNAAASFVQLLSFRSDPVLWSIHHTVYRLRDEKTRTAGLIWLSMLVARLARQIIYVSRESADRHEALGFAANRTTIIPNGFDCEQFKPSSHASIALRRQLNVSQDAILIGLIGRFHAQKDHATFFEAAGMVYRTNEEIHFVLAGQGVDPRNPVLAEYIERFRLSDRVHMLGERDDIPELTAGLDIATSSSSFGESFPLVVGEAMACGVPCVVTDIGHSAAIVGETGLVVPPRDPAALAAAWARLVDAGGAARARLGADARQRILENFSLDQIVRQYEVLYDETLQNRIVEA